MSDDTTRHQHSMSYAIDGIVEAIDHFPGKVEKTLHQLVVVHDHPDGHSPHHHIDQDPVVTETVAPKEDSATETVVTETVTETVTEPKPETKSLWWGDRTG